MRGRAAQRGPRGAGALREFRLLSRTGSAALALPAARSYRIFARGLASRLPFPELPPGPGLEAELRIEPGRGPAPDPVACEPVNQWTDPGGAVNLEVHRGAAGHVLRFPRLATFRVEPGARSVQAWPEPACTPDTLRHLLLDQVIPRVLAHRGALVLHAATVCLPDRRALALMGPTGAGKSTLAGGFEVYGHGLLSDDSAGVEAAADGVFAIPGYASLRLLDDAREALFPKSPSRPMAHYSSKQRLGASAASSGTTRLPLAALLVLAGRTDGTPALRRLTGAAALLALVRNAYFLDIGDAAHQARFLDQAAALLARGLPVMEFAYPRRFEALPGIVRFLDGALAGPGQGGMTSETRSE